jgi:integrase/recombinase XerD
MARRRNVSRFLLAHEVEALLKAAKTRRDQLIMLLMRFAGLRVSEVCKLCVEHIDMEGAAVWVRDGKGGKDRRVPVQPFLKRALRGWVGTRGDGPVFVSAKGGGHLTTRAVQLLIKRLAIQAKLPEARRARKYHPHSFRHFYATDLLDKGATIYQVMELLGHENLNTTQQYLHATPEQLARAANLLTGGR